MNIEAQDPTPNTAILIDDAGVVVADFLAYVAGLNETDILRRRVPMTTENGRGRRQSAEFPSSLPSPNAPGVPPDGDSAWQS